MASAFRLSMQLGARMGRSVRQTFQGAQGQLSSLGHSLQRLERQQQGIRRFEMDTSGVQQARSALLQARRRVSALRHAMQQTSAPTQAMASQLQQAQQRVTRLGHALHTQQQRLQQSRQALQAQGLSATQTSADNERLGQSIDRLSRRYQRLQRVTEAQSRRTARRDQLRGEMFDTIAVGASLVAPLRVAIAFEASLDKLGAVTRATAEDQTKLTVEARKLGEQTQFSASQSAEAMTFLGMAGLNVQQILAATGGMLNLAAASGEELGVTADIASNILSGFNLEAESMGRVGNVLTATFTRSNTTLSMLGETMKYTAPIAAATGASVEQVAAMAGLLGSAGIQAGNSGRALQQVFTRLSAPTGEAATVLSELGIETQDAMGNLRSVPVLFQEIADSMDSLGSAQRAGAINAIFGQVALASVTTLLDQAQGGKLSAFIGTLEGAEGRQELATVARRMSDNTQGALQRLGSALESVAISLGNTLLPTITTMAEVVARGASHISAFAQRFPRLTQFVVGTVTGLIALKTVLVGTTFIYSVLASAVGSLSVAYTVLTTRLSLAQLNVIRLAAVARLSTVTTALMTAAQWAWNIALSANPIGLIVIGISALVGAGYFLIKHWDKVKTFFLGIWERLKTVTGSAVAFMREKLQWIIQPLGWVINAFGKILGTGRAPTTKVAAIDDDMEHATTANSALTHQTPLPTAIHAPARVQSNDFRVDAPITIHAAPGTDAQQVGEEVRRQLAQHQQQQAQDKRSQLFDYTYF